MKSNDNLMHEFMTNDFISFLHIFLLKITLRSEIRKLKTKIKF